MPLHSELKQTMHKLVIGELTLTLCRQGSRDGGEEGDAATGGGGCRSGAAGSRTQCAGYVHSRGDRLDETWC